MGEHQRLWYLGVTVFGDLFKTWNANWTNGENDATIFNKALEIFQKEHNKTLKHIEFWNVVKDCQKW